MLCKHTTNLLVISMTNYYNGLYFNFNSTSLQAGSASSSGPAIVPCINVGTQREQSSDFRAAPGEGITRGIRAESPVIFTVPDEDLMSAINSPSNSPHDT